MTPTEIAYVVDTVYKYDMNDWIDFKDVTLIGLNQSANVFTDEREKRFRFNTTTQQMEIVYGVATQSGFISDAGETEDYTPQSFVPFLEIGSFHKSVWRGFQGTYFKKHFGGPAKIKIQYWKLPEFN